MCVCPPLSTVCTPSGDGFWGVFCVFFPIFSTRFMRTSSLSHCSVAIFLCFSRLKPWSWSMPAWYGSEPVLMPLSSLDWIVHRAARCPWSGTEIYCNLFKSISSIIESLFGIALFSLARTAPCLVSHCHSVRLSVLSFFFVSSPGDCPPPAGGLFLRICSPAGENFFHLFPRFRSLLHTQTHSLYCFVLVFLGLVGSPSPQPRGPMLCCVTVRH